MTTPNPSLNAHEDLVPPSSVPPPKKEFSEHVDFEKWFMPWDLAYRKHPNVTSAVTNLTGEELRQDILQGHPRSREGIPGSPRWIPKVTREDSKYKIGPVVQIEYSREDPYEPRLVEGAALAIRAVASRVWNRIRGRNPHPRHPSYGIPEVMPFNIDEYRDLFRDSELRKLTVKIDKQIEGRRDGRNSLSQDEVETIRELAILEYAGNRATPMLLHELGKWQRYITRVMRSEARPDALEEVFTRRQEAERRAAEDRARDIEERRAEAEERRTEARAARAREESLAQTLSNLTNKMDRTTESHNAVTNALAAKITQLTAALEAINLSGVGAAKGATTTTPAEAKPVEYGPDPADTLLRQPEALRTVINSSNERGLSEDSMAEALKARGMDEARARHLSHQFLVERANLGWLTPPAEDSDDKTYEFGPGMNRKEFLKRFHLGSTEIHFSSN